jgi:hypothetical protein
MSNLRDELQAAFAAAFPPTNAMACIELANQVEDLGDGRFGFTMRLTVCDLDAQGRQSIRDVKEQQLTPNLSKLVSNPQRTAAFARAHAAVLSQVFASHGEIECLMPHDLVSFQPLLLAKSKTEDDFAKALATKSRLGKYLPS